MLKKEMARLSNPKPSATEEEEEGEDYWKTEAGRLSEQASKCNEMIMAASQPVSQVESRPSRPCPHPSPVGSAAAGSAAAASAVAASAAT